VTVAALAADDKSGERDRNMENATGRSMFPAEHRHMDSGRQLGPNSCIMLSW